ncbi:LacI family DNA-binding transcriptional regulator [Streptomonospora salina]|uniref:DNA-binding LacI/PurR family transcriptional regulator n=1 Tax=Streptomonospora salina TaxID=104205 RepID=A0A841E1M7_9ACTN|nr:LacI family DNA-binding transcriptional regulator [Streptomonospora salina]MBB5997035.1 DNA-binding LacI/PurR family transcriptional regulator [Streptomonospora salina]
MTDSKSATGAAEPRRRPTMGDVAERVGVSRQLVSLVMRDQAGPSDETRRRVREAADELGYRPHTAAQLLRRTRSRQIGVLFNMDQPHNVELVEGLYACAQDVGYGIALSANVPSRGERQAIEELLGLRSEALILTGPSPGPSPDLSRVAEQVPVVQVSRSATVPGADLVRSSEAPGMSRAIGYLAELGHRDIVHVDGGAALEAEERRRGYRDAMRRHGLADRARELPGAFTEESGARAARELLARGTLPTAVVTANDRCARGLLDVFVRAGVGVPQEVSVIGYDDSRLAHLSFLDLTSVRQDSAQLAELAVQAVTERLDDGRTGAKEFAITPTLTVRGTSGPVRTAE